MTRAIIGKILLLAATLVCAQNYDILQRAAPTAVYVETAYEGNEDRPDCDWYATATEFVEASIEGADRFGTDCLINIRIRGVINQEGANRFRLLAQHLAESRHRTDTIILNSKGGDADAAMTIGRLVRSEETFRNVRGGVRTAVADTYDAACFSACVVIFAAGFRRSADFDIYDDANLPSRLGIHGPAHFDATANAYDSSATNRQLQRVARALKTYFAELDINEQLVEDMYAIPFDEIKLLTRRDLLDYGIPVN